MLFTPVCCCDKKKWREKKRREEKKTQQVFFKKHRWKKHQIQHEMHMSVFKIETIDTPTHHTTSTKKKADHAYCALKEEQRNE